MNRKAILVKVRGRSVNLVEETMKNIHFVGIGGVGMSGIAKVLLEMGYHISGSDLKESEMTKKLEALGAVIHQGHDGKNLNGASVVVVSSAIPKTNPEVIAAQERHIPVWQRAEMLAKLMGEKKGIAVAGAHGKTTTSSMIASILEGSHYDPTIVIGGVVNDMGVNAKLGRGEYLVAEADESDGSMLKLDPVVAVITNIEDDHLDHYGSMENIMQAFKEFINKIPQEGFVLLCNDNSNIQEMKKDVKVKSLTYGLTEDADYIAKEIGMENLSSSFQVWKRGEKLGEINLRIPGLHNVYNALAATAVCLEQGLSFEQIKAALALFSGVQRRFQIIGRIKDTLVVDDYAHHPTEIRATLRAAREGWKGRIITVFQPHRYTRTKLLEQEFIRAFSQTDKLILNEIYSAGESPIPGISSDRLRLAIEKQENKEVELFSSKEETVNYLLENVQEGDLIITVGAGDVWMVAKELAYKLKNTIEG